MYLKSIEIHGFKSFANKIVFDFHNGITGIVGPNGSGKSNVADAVRWVLGEQRVKQLRGGSMQDVIFAGTELRKPQGFASVAITLDNSDHQLAIDYEQVTVTRRLYRSGESDYLINGSSCRLKDINELFYDTGIGKEGYSIIGQGQIDKILSGKPEERRELFDEAAGIVKFKRRKLIAQKKLDDEQQNLVRVSDILSELEKQVGPLARQSETAKKYLALREELKTYDVNLFLMESAQIKEQLQEVEKRSGIVSGDLEDANVQAEHQKAEYDRLDGELAQLDQTINEKRTLYTQAEMLGGNLEGQINVLNEQINTERLRAEHIQDRTHTLKDEIRKKEEQISGYHKDHQSMEEAVDDIRRRRIAVEYAAEQEEWSIQSLERQSEEAKNNVLYGMNTKADLSAKAQHFETMQEQVQVRRSEVLQKLLKFKSDESVQDEELKEERRRLKEAEQRLCELQQLQTVTEGECEQLEVGLSRLNRSLNEKQKEFHTTNTRMESLRNLAERYEGYGNSTRRIMEVRDRVPGIHGVVADLIKTDRQYETAIETALGGSIQNIVTDTEQTAKKLIEYLKKNKFGRVTFLPLTSIGQGGSFNRPEVLKEPGVIGMGSDLVAVAPEYKGLAQNLLGRVVVAKSIDYAIALARKYKYSLRIVTLEGELLNAGGSMTGGAFKNNSNLLGRRRELEEMENICSRVKKEIQKLEEELKLQEGLLTEKKEELERVRRDLHQIALRQNTLMMSVNQIEEKRSEIQDSYQGLVQENSRLEHQLREIEAERTRIRKDSSALEEQNEQVNAAAAELSQKLNEARTAKAEAAKKLEEINLEEANLRQKSDFVMENVHRLEEEIEALRNEMEELQNSSGDSVQIVEEKQAEISRLRELIEHAAAEKQNLSLELDALNETKNETSRAQRGFFAKREELTERISRLDKDLFRLQNQKEKLDEKLEHQINYMWNEYELTLTTAAPLRDPKLQVLADIRRRIDELKTAIRGLGNVNVNAIEDYKEVSERYEFMKTQHDDLAEAEAELLKIIEELDEGMRRQFSVKFQEIRKEFDRVFKELFGGGHGTLELMEDVDILEAGIQIIAQPPGKKLQNMMQLSGGEKALTAIALLFAIQNLKPSPFCLLDEIEAALDDSNVDRFAGYLHKLTKNTQFIVITHRRGTMVSADRLYGITMQEKGVSTLVSVNLIEDQLDE